MWKVGQEIRLFAEGEIPLIETFLMDGNYHRGCGVGAQVLQISLNSFPVLLPPFFCYVHYRRLHDFHSTSSSVYGIHIKVKQEFLLALCVYDFNSYVSLKDTQQ